MRALGFEIKKAEVLKILKDYDREESGKIGFDDFKEVATDMMLERDPMQELLKVSGGSFRFRSINKSIF